MKLFGRIKIFEKIENKTSISFRKTGLTERENMVTLNQAWANRRSQIFLIQKNLSKLKGVIYLW